VSDCAIVVGANGYIGAELVSHLACRMDVLAVDKTKRTLTRDIVEIDLSHESAIETILDLTKRKKVGSIYYCGGFFPKRPDERREPLENTYLQCHRALEHTVDIAKQLKSSLYYLSTLPLGRGDSFQNSSPLALYFASKRLDEELVLRESDKLYGVTILRLARVVGLGRVHRESLPYDIVSQFICARREGRTLPVSRPGMRVPYVHLVELVKNILDGEYAGVARARVIEVGSCDTISVWETFQIVNDVVSRGSMERIEVREVDDGALAPPTNGIVVGTAREVIRTAVLEYLSYLGVTYD
jgi:nucleoside-diphosphate-sugar epimerase